jgi:SAM-dependent methyltransferase
MKKFKIIPPGYFVPEMGNGLNELSYPEEGNAFCYEIEDCSQWFQARNRSIHAVLERFPFPGDFLDIGGGNGYQLAYLQKSYFLRKQIISAMCEPGPEGCANAAGRGVANVYCCLADDFPFDQFNVGGIGLFDVIEHIEDDVAFLKEIASYLQTGSRMYITVPAMKNLWSEEDKYAGHYRRFNNFEVQRIVKGTKLKFIHAHYFFSYYVPFVWLLRVLPGKIGKKLDQELIKQREEQYHKGSMNANIVLNIFHFIESIVIKTGINPWIGTSQIIVLEKI